MLVKCETCDGCGKLADTEDREPWSRWLEIPVKSALALQIGLVRPIPCTVCKGKGKVPDYSGNNADRIQRSLEEAVTDLRESVKALETAVNEYCESIASQNRELRAVAEQLIETDQKQKDALYDKK